MKLRPQVLPDQPLQFRFHARRQRRGLVLAQDLPRLAPANRFHRFPFRLPRLISIATQDSRPLMLAERPPGVFALEKITSRRVGLNQGHFFLQVMLLDALHHPP